MLKRPGFAVISGSVCLLLYCIALQFESLYSLAWFLFSIFPFMIIWIAYTVFKYGKYEGPQLNEEEFGYQDKNKSELGIF